MNPVQREQAIARLERRAAYLERRLEQGHPHKTVTTRWRRELLQTRAVIACRRDDRRRGAWPEYLEREG